MIHPLHKEVLKRPMKDRIANHARRLSEHWTRFWECVYNSKDVLVKLKQKPFFANSFCISVKLDDQADDNTYFPWLLETNPTECEIDEYDLKELFIFALHVSNHYNSRIEIPDNWINDALSIFSDILKQVINHIDGILSLDTVMDIYNILMAIINYFYVKTEYELVCLDLRVHLTEFFELLQKFTLKCESKVFGQDTFFNSVLSPAIESLRETIERVEWLNAMLPSNVTRTKMHEFKETVHLSQVNLDCEFFGVQFRDFHIKDGKITIRKKEMHVLLSDIYIEILEVRARNMTIPSVKLLRNRLIRSKRQLKKYHNFCDIIRRQEFTKSDLKIYTQALWKFKERFWVRREEKNEYEQNSPLDTHEICYVLDFIKNVVDSCYLLGMNGYLKEVPGYIEGFDCILNSMDVYELLSVNFSLPMCTALAKSLKKLFNHEFKRLMPRLPANLLFISARMMHVLSCHHGVQRQMYMTDEQTQYISIQPRIVNFLTDIPKTRISSWTKLLEKHPTPESWMKEFERGDCSICADDMSPEKIWVFSCGHPLCYQCLVVFVAGGFSGCFSCHMCRQFVNEYMLVEKMEEVLGNIKKKNAIEKISVSTAWAPSSI